MFNIRKIKEINEFRIKQTIKEKTKKPKNSQNMMVEINLNASKIIIVQISSF